MGKRGREVSMHSSIDVTVAAIVPDGEQFLFVEERVGGQLVFNQPAGHLESGESLTDAVIRETLEETGFHFHPESLVGIYLWRCDEIARSFLRVTFVGSAEPPELTPELDDGIVATHWLTRNQLLSPKRRLRSPMVMRCLDDFLADIRYPLDCLTELARDVHERAHLAG